jgi:HAMP domain-containing protein
VVPGVGGTWKDLTDNVNLLAANLTTQVRNIAEVTTAVARGDLSRKITVDVKGEILELKNTINTMVDQLNAFAAEVTRVAREVGTEGLLGGQAQVPGVAGTWKDLTDNVNVMAANLTEQVRGIVKVVTAVANGDLEQNLTVKAKGEVAALADTINNMTGTLATFADQVTSVAREVGVEGRLGGQANVPGAAGTWKGPHRATSTSLRPTSRRRCAPSRSRHGRDEGRPHAIDSGRCARRGRGAERQHQHDDRQPAVDDRPQHRAGLAQDQPRPGSPACCRASAISPPSASCSSRSSCRSSMRTRASSIRWRPTRTWRRCSGCSRATPRSPSIRTRRSCTSAKGSSVNARATCAAS